MQQLPGSSDLTLLSAFHYKQNGSCLPTACSWLKNPAVYPPASTGQKEVLLSSLVPLAWLQLARGMNKFKSDGFLVEFGVFLHWCVVELPMTAKENGSLIENSSSYNEGLDMVKLTLRNLSIIKHSYYKFLIKTFTANLQWTSHLTKPLPASYFHRLCSYEWAILMSFPIIFLLMRSHTNA